MKKLPLLLGTLGGGLAGYLFSNKKLRNELTKAKDAKSAAKILGKYLSTDGEKLGKDVKDFLESEYIQESVSTAKKYASDQYKKAKQEIDRLTVSSGQTVKKAAKKGAVKAKTAVKTSRRKITNKVRKIKKG